MGLQVVEYSVRENSYQSKIGRHRFNFQMAAIIIVALNISACSITNPNLADLESTSTVVNKSVATPTQAAGVASTDADVIKKTVAEAKITSGISTALAWRNPATGSSGTIMAIDNFLGKHGQKCRGFKTTVSTFMGIAFYNGEACQISTTEWVLSWFRLSESKS